MTVATMGLRQPGAQVYHNLAITGLSVAVAMLIGTIELVTVPARRPAPDPLTGWISGINRTTGVIVGLFVVTWTVAIAYRRIRTTLAAPHGSADRPC